LTLSPPTARERRGDDNYQHTETKKREGVLQNQVEPVTRRSTNRPFEPGKVKNELSKSVSVAHTRAQISAHPREGWRWEDPMRNEKRRRVPVGKRVREWGEHARRPSRENGESNGKFEKGNSKWKEEEKKTLIGLSQLAKHVGRAGCHPNKKKVALLKQRKRTKKTGGKPEG